MILVFGILGIVCCFIFGIVAWVMANADLQAMAVGEMDKTGEGLTKAGKICGIIGIALQVAYLILQVILFALGMGLAFSGSGGP